VFLKLPNNTFYRMHRPATAYCNHHSPHGTNKTTATQSEFTQDTFTAQKWHGQTETAQADAAPPKRTRRRHPKAMPVECTCPEGYKTVQANEPGAAHSSRVRTRFVPNLHLQDTEYNWHN
jgi:hypothetical protein